MMHRSRMTHACWSVLLLCVTACHGLLDVSNPTLIQDKDIANATGANGRRLNAMQQFDNQVGQADRRVAYFTD